MAKRKYGKRMRRRSQLILILEDSDADLVKAVADAEGISVSEKLRRMLEPWIEQMRLNPELKSKLMYPLRIRPVPTPTLEARRR